MRRISIAAVLVPLAMGAAFAAGAAETMPAKNLDFTRWDERGRPEGWGAGSFSSFYTIASDCEVKREGRCALRIAGGEGRPIGDFQPLAQSLPPGGAAGHHLVVSGWIRTENLKDGW